MENELQQKNIIITEVQTLDWGLKIKDEKGLVYNIPELKKDTQEQTVAYANISALPKNGLNLNKCFKFVSVPSKEPGRLSSRYVRIITEPSDEQGNTEYKSPAMSTSEPVRIENNEEEKWNKINFGKCKHQFLLEAFKLFYAKNGHIEDKNKEERNSIERLSEEWAKMSMRVLSEDIVEQVKETFNGREIIDIDDDIKEQPFGKDIEPPAKFLKD